MKKPPQVNNQAAMQKWDDYVNKLPNRQAALLPMDIDIKQGKIYRKLITATGVKRFFAAHKKDIPDYMRAYPKMTPTMVDFPNIDEVFKHYIGNIKSGGQTPATLNPLDIETNRPTYFLFRLSRKDVNAPTSKYVKWRFTADKQITCHNDGLGPFLNLLPICTLDDGKTLLAYNRHRCNPPNLKFDLHVTIEQKVKDGRQTVIAKTPIIIDPGLGNGGASIP